MGNLLVSVGCGILLNVSVVIAEVEGQDCEDKEVEVDVKASRT